MAYKPNLGVVLLASLSVLCNAQEQASARPELITVRRIEATKLVDKQRQPQEIETKISLQTQGKVVYALDFFYRSPADTRFEQVHCDLLPNLKYYARFPYRTHVEYYLVATPLVGSTTRIASGTILGPDLEASRLGIAPGEGYLAAGGSAVIALVTAALTNSDRPATNPHTNSNFVPYVAIGASLVGTITTVILCRNRHKKYKDVQAQPATN